MLVSKITKVLLLLTFLLVYAGSFAQVKFDYNHLNNPIKYKDSIEKHFDLEEIERYVYNDSTNNVLLKNGYAQSLIANQNAWSSIKNNVIAQTVTVIFTKYPKKKEDWLTNFYNLLGKRLLELYKLDSSLNSPNIKYKIILQTNCDTEEETKSLLHVIKIDYIPKTSVISYDTIKHVQQDDLSVRLVNNLISKKPVKDSTLAKVMMRNNYLKNAVFAMNYDKVFFNDEIVTMTVNSVLLSQQASQTVDYFVVLLNKSIDPYASNIPQKVENVYINSIFTSAKTFTESFNMETERRSSIDDVVASLFANKQNINSDKLVVIASNYFDYDYFYLTTIGMPLCIVLKNIKRSSDINPLYFLLAKKTNATIHTINKDFSYAEINRHYENNKKNNPNFCKIEAELNKRELKPNIQKNNNHSNSKDLDCPSFR